MTTTTTTNSPSDCARRLLALFRRRGRIRERASVGFLVSHFLNRDFSHDDYRHAIAFARDKSWIAFPPDNSVVLTPLGVAALSQRDPQQSAAAAEPDLRRSSR